MNQVVVLTGYEEKKTGESKRGPWALRLFTAAGGTKFQTFDVDLGNKLIKFVEEKSSVDLEYEIEDNGNFQNNVVKSAKAANGNGQATGGVDYVSVQNDLNQATAKGMNSTVSADRELRIMRQSALDRAINTVAAGIGDLNPKEVPITDLFTLADQYISYFENGAA